MYFKKVLDELTKNKVTCLSNFSKSGRSILNGRESTTNNEKKLPIPDHTPEIYPKYPNVWRKKCRNIRFTRLIPDFM